jgi:hypothetical protein
MTDRAQRLQQLKDLHNSLLNTAKETFCPALRWAMSCLAGGPGVDEMRRIVNRVCLGAGSIEDGQRLRSYIETLESRAVPLAQPTREHVLDPQSSNLETLRALVRHQLEMDDALGVRSADWNRAAREALAVAVETPAELSKYERAVEFLRDIADLAGTTKRKQAGCEIAAHALAQLGESRSSEKAPAEPWCDACMGAHVPGDKSIGCPVKTTERKTDGEPV